MRILLLLISIIGYPLVGRGAVESQSGAAVLRYFSGLNSLQAEFVQKVFNDQSHLLQTSSGKVFMQKPGRFRWDYQEPFKQLIVADGTRLWLYDSELQQVTVKRLDKALSTTPLALLSGEAPIDKAFTIGAASSSGGMVWYELRPKDPQAEFKLLRVGFSGNTLKMLELEDVFNQRTRLSFEKLERNVDIDPALMRFTPPPGVDVVGDLP